MHARGIGLRNTVAYRCAGKTELYTEALEMQDYDPKPQTLGALGFLAAQLPFLYLGSYLITPIPLSTESITAAAITDPT